MLETIRVQFYTKVIYEFRINYNVFFAYYSLVECRNCKYNRYWFSKSSDGNNKAMFSEFIIIYITETMHQTFY